jgi:prevent-host-death family protein
MEPETILPIFKGISATEMKNRFGDYLGSVIHRREPLVIEKHGKPVAVIVDFDQWQKLREEKSLAREKHPWTSQCRRLSDAIRKNHPNAKPFSASRLVHEIREEEG